jgi:hypothetical protein
VELNKNVEEGVSLQNSDTLECLSFLCKSLDSSLRVILKSIGKTDTSKKQSQIKWMNDIEQRNAESRDLLFTDLGLPFVDLSVEKTMPPEKFDLQGAQDEYLFYQLHDRFTETNFNDVNRRSTWLAGATEIEAMEVNEYIKDTSFFKIVKQVFNLLDIVVAPIAEKAKT